MSEIPSDLPVIPLPGSEAWSDAYDWGRLLDKRFPGQDAEDFAYACSYNDFGPTADHLIADLVMVQQGANDEADWVWRVTFVDGSQWVATGGCDFTGWDCQSDLSWVEAEDPTQTPDPLDTATQWLNLHSDCDIECKQNHPVNHSTVSGLHAAAATARIAAAEYKRERDELQVSLIDAVAQLRALAGRSPVPPAGALRLLASRLEEEL